MPREGFTFLSDFFELVTHKNSKVFEFFYFFFEFFYFFEFF
jgi:hypothetical protein